MWFGISVFIAVTVIIVGVIVGAILFILNIRKNNGTVDARDLLKIYLYLVSLMTLVGIVFGGSILLKVGLSYAFGYPFSYNVISREPMMIPADPNLTVPQKEIDQNYIDPNFKNEIVYNNKKYGVNYEDRKRDIINGLTFFLSMLVLFFIHRMFVMQVDGDKKSMYRKFYTFISLAIFSILGILLLPASLYTLINFYLIDANKLGNYSNSLPGESIALAVFVIPLWIYFFMKQLQINDETSKHVEPKVSAKAK